MKLIWLTFIKWSVVRTHLLEDSYVPVETVNVSFAGGNLFFPQGQLQTGSVDAAPGWAGQITHPSAPDERCKWKPPLWRSNQTPSTHVNADCQDGQPASPGAWQAWLTCCELCRKHSGSYLRLCLCSGLHERSEKMVGIVEAWGLSSPSLSSFSSWLLSWPWASTLKSGERKGVEFKAVYLPWLLDKLFPQITLLYAWLRTTLVAKQPTSGSRLQYLLEL